MTFRSANQWAVSQLSNQSPEYSAKKLWRRNHSFNIILACLYGLFLYFTGYTGLVWSLNIFAFTFFVYRFVLTILGLRGDKDKTNMLSVDDPTLPRYAVLLPMRNEPTDVVQDLITNIDNLNYPKDKLDVIMLVDEDDDYLQEIEAMEKPEHFRVMSAYADAPFTKPKVCNVGLMQTDAEYVTIYDAEDKPDPDQLLKVLYKFRSDENISCVQCRLNYNNQNNNWLTKFFTNEYLTWFSLTIRGLSIAQGNNGIIPLGGTSQHLKVEELIALGGWDAFNVTEDCELGVRLVRKGKRIVVSDSWTDEIAVDKMSAWYKQRTRWQLGYMVTYLTHSVNPLRLIKDIGLNRTFHFFMSILGAVLNPLLTPLLFVIFILSLTGYGAGETYLYYLPMVTLIGNYILIAAAHMIASIKYNNGRYLIWALLQPIYYLFQAVTVYRAVYKLATAYDKWEKTPHTTEQVEEKE